MFFQQSKVELKCGTYESSQNIIFSLLLEFYNEIQFIFFSVRGQLNYYFEPQNYKYVYVSSLENKIID